MEAIQKILADNKRVRNVTDGCDKTQSSAATEQFLLVTGACDRLVQTAQKLGATDDAQGGDRPREPEVCSVQPPHRLRAADHEQSDAAGFNSPA